MKLLPRNLKEPIMAYNVDGTLNKKGTIKQFVKLNLDILGKTYDTRLLITGLGKQKIILGFPWLQLTNPVINWQTGDFQWRDTPRKQEQTITKTPTPKPTIEDEEDEEEWKNHTVNVIETDESDDSISEVGINHINICVINEDEGTMRVIDGETNGNEIWINTKTNLALEMAIKDNLAKEERTTEELVPKEFHDYLDIFDEKNANRFPIERPWDHKIELKENFEPKSFKIYNLSPAEQHELDTFLKENLEKGYIRPSQSPMASPFFFVKKKDGKLRPCQDYRYLNDWTIKNAYPLPLISDIMDKLKGSKYFTKLDVRWGYNNIRIKKGDEWKAAFKTNRGLYEPTVMFFGMCNSPATFQSMMDNIFIVETDAGFLIIYMDDLLIHAPTQALLTERTKIVLQKLRDNDLFLKAKKCSFNQTKLEYLGLVVEEGKISTDPVKVKGFAEWPVPKSVKEVRSFLGFGNFYRKFIGNYSQIAAPLNSLLKKDVPFHWENEQQMAFETLKHKLTTSPTLMMPDQTKPYQIEADASKYASGALLTQTDTNGDRHPIAYLSKTFNDTERNYDIYDRELLAIKRALEEWRHYIQGSGHPTIIYSDHQNLTYFRSAQKLNKRQARWALFLSEFDIKLIHQPGHKMTQADALSRRPDLIPEFDNDNVDVTLLPDNLFINLLDLTLQQEFLDLGQNDSFLSGFSIDNPPFGTKSDWKIETIDGQISLFYKDRNYVPNDTDLRRKILHVAHDHETAGHPGEQETIVTVEKDYWWPGLRSFVRNYVKGCGPCQQFKIDRRPSHPSYIPIPSDKVTRPFAKCSMDLITDLPPSNGFDSILVVVDRGLTKGVILLPCNKTITNEEVGRLLLENLYKRFGLPNEIISDRGPQFAAKGFRELLKLLGVTSKLSTAYHPQTDGATERVNQEIEVYLSIYCSRYPTDWTEKIHLMEFTHNNRRHAERKHSPFELMFGEPPKTLPTSFEKTNFPNIELRMQGLIKDREEALSAHELAARRIADMRRNTFKPFALGDNVWLDNRNIKTTNNPKIGPRREGPFRISEVLGPLTYRLDLPNTWKVHNVFHATLLRPYVENAIHGTNYPRPPSELVDSEEVYEVERILKHRKRGRGYQYLILWRGYPISDATWEPESAFSDDGDMLETYKDQYQL